MTKHVDNLKVQRKPVEADADLTVRELNILARGLDEAPMQFLEVLRQSISEEAYQQISEFAPAFRNAIAQLIQLNLCDPSQPDIHPATRADLDERIERNKERLPAFFEECHISLPEDAQLVFKAAYEKVCHTMTHALEYETLRSPSKVYLQ